MTRRQRDRVRQHAAVAKMSTRGKQLIAKGIGHHIQLEAPELVEAAIREVLGLIKR